MHDDENIMFLNFATILEPTLIDYDRLLSTTLEMIDFYRVLLSAFIVGIRHA
jgi:hypothetical protein